MALLFCKSGFYRKAILLGLSAGLAGQMLGVLPLFPQTATPSTPSGGVTRREVANQIVTQEQAELPGDAGSQQSSTSVGKKDRALMKANYEKAKHDAQELADLAKALQQELSASNDRILSLDVINKAGQIEKLAKRIKGTARGF